MKLKAFLKMRYALAGASAHTNIPMEARVFISYGTCRTQVTQVTPPPPGERQCANLRSYTGSTGGRDWIVPIFGGDLQVFFVHHDFDAAVGGTAGYGLRGIAQGVLIPRLVGDLRIRVFDRVAREPAKVLFPAGCRDIFRKDEVGALSRQMELPELTEAG